MSRPSLARVVVVSVLAIWSLGSTVLAQRTSQAELASALRDGSDQERVAAIAAVHAIPPSQRSDELFSALLYELDRQRRQLDARRSALEAGQGLSPVPDHGEYLFSVIDAVAQHSDNPAILPALLPFLGTGNRVINAIAAFGDDAVDGVLDVAGSVQSEPRVVASAIRVLERMLYDGASLSATSMAGILEVANQRLSGTQAYIVLAKAAELAVATGDSQLRRRVERLAQDPDAVRAVIRGDDLDVENTQRRATAALASNPAR